MLVFALCLSCSGTEVWHLNYDYLIKAFENRCSYQDHHASLKDQPLGPARLKIELKQDQSSDCLRLMSLEPKLQITRFTDLRERLRKFLRQAFITCCCECILTTTLVKCRQH